MHWHGSAPDVAAAILYNAANNPGAASFTFMNLVLTGLLNESATDGVTAHAGGGQTNATPITTELTRVTTVATAGDSVVLPASSPGLTIIVVNAGANPMQVYGLGTDTINGSASGTGVTQMQSSEVLYTCTLAGIWIANGIGNGFSGSFTTVSAVNGVTAHAGGGQASAVPITAMITRVTTVATAGDSVVLPASATGLEITVANAASNSMNVFPAGTDQVNSLGASTAYALAGGKTATFFCANSGQWHALLSA